MKDRHQHQTSPISAHPLLNEDGAERDAFERSLQEILALDFEQIVLGHGEPITGNAKETLIRIFEDLGFDV